MHILLFVKRLIYPTIMDINNGQQLKTEIEVIIWRVR